MSTYTCNAPRLRENFANSIIERNSKGHVIGTYKGYWNANKRRVTLYPDYRHPALPPGSVLRKKDVYDGDVLCTKTEAPVRKAPKKDEPTSRRKGPLEGQERIKFT